MNLLNPKSTLKTAPTPFCPKAAGDLSCVLETIVLPKVKIPVGQPLRPNTTTVNQLLEQCWSLCQPQGQNALDPVKPSSPSFNLLLRFVFLRVHSQSIRKKRKYQEPVLWGSFSGEEPVLS